MPIPYTLQSSHAAAGHSHSVRITACAGSGLSDDTDGGDLTTDAWIAAIALAHGASVLTLDSDFARFPGVRWESPLSG